MSVSLDERAHAASTALLAAAELRRADALPDRRRAPIRVVATAVVLVVAVILGVFFAVRAAAPRKGGAAAQPTSQYEARAVVLSMTRNGDTSSLSQDSLLLTVGVVPNRVAQQLRFHGTPSRLAEQIHVAIFPKAGQITITSVQPTADRAMAIVNDFAEQLVRYLAQVQQASYDTAVRKALDRTQQLARERATVLAQLVKNPNDAALKAQEQALQAAFAGASANYAAIVSSGAESPVRIGEARDARRLASVPAARSRHHIGIGIALALFGLIGLCGALGFALGRHRTAART